MWSKMDHELLSKAIAFKDSGQIRAAIDLVTDVSDRNPGRASLHWFLGHLYWKLDSLNDAINHFRKATILAPTMERASLGLFHCLWEQGNQVAALDEIKRFMAISDSEDYRKITRELTLEEG
jgi:tetratricopeptide (TPR) repeat protein